jgi:hypothetical protein
MIFSSIFVFSFAVFCMIFGAFTAYFGTGRSRNIGGALILFGLIALIIVLWFTGVIPEVTRPIIWELDIVIEAIIAVVAAIIGGGAALGIFLGAIMKS